MRRDDLRLDEEVAEGRVGGVGGRRRHDYLRIARHLDRAPRARAIRYPDAPDLDVVLRRDGDLRMRVDLAIAAPVLGARLGEDRIVGLRLPQRRLVGRGPHLAARQVAEVAERAVAIASRVLLPARDREVAPTAIAAPGVGHHDVVAAVGKQVHLRQGGIGVAEHSEERLVLAGALPQPGRLGGVWVEGRDLRRTLLQQALRRPEDRLGEEAALHRPAEERVGEREEAHTLVVRHERPHERELVAARQARGRVVDRFVEAVAALRAEVSEPLKICACLFRRDHQRHRGRVGRDDEILREAPLEAKPRHAEGAILVVEVGVRRIVAGLRDAPRDAPLRAVLDLATDNGLVGPVEHGAAICGHHDERHQVLEHGAAPGEESGVGAGGRHEAAEREPVILRHVSLRDADEAGEPRL